MSSSDEADSASEEKFENEKGPGVWSSFFNPLVTPTLATTSITLTSLGLVSQLVQGAPESKFGDFSEQLQISTVFAVIQKYAGAVIQAAVSSAGLSPVTMSSFDR